MCSSKQNAAVEDLQHVVASIGDLGIDWTEVARLQPLDPEFLQLRRDSRSGLNWKSVDIGECNILVDISNGPARPYIPFPLRKRVFDVLHGLGHPGVERTRQTVSSKVVWPSMRTDVSKWARECLSCQQAKVTRHITPPIGDFAIPNKRFEHLNLDLVTLPRSNGFKYLLTAVDRFTRWPIAIPLVDISAQSVCEAFTYGWIAHYGVPATITTDRGSQFSSASFQQLTKIWGVKVQMTAPYHPEANGLVERLHRRLKEALIALGAEQPQDWFWKLPCVLLAIRTTFKPDIGASPADLVYGEGLAVPGEILSNTPSTEPHLARQRRAALADLRLEVARFQPTPTSTHRNPRLHLPEDLNTCTHVFVRRGGVASTLSSPYLGPYRVISRNEFNFKIAIPGRSAEVVSISRVKPAVVDADAEEDPPAASPPRPGRQPRRPQPQRTTQSDRQTRQDRRQQSPPPLSPSHVSQPPSRSPQPSTSGHGGVGTSTAPSSPRRHQPWSEQVEDFYDDAPQDAEDMEGEAPSHRQLQRASGGEDSNAPSTSTSAAAPAAPEVASGPPKVVKKTLSFSNPKPGNFSYRRRPDVSALNALVRAHLDEHPSSTNSVSSSFSSQKDVALPGFEPLPA